MFARVSLRRRIRTRTKRYDVTGVVVGILADCRLHNLEIAYKLFVPFFALFSELIVCVRRIIIMTR